MALLIAIGSLTAGVIIGAVATYRFSSTSPVKVRQLEQQIEDLQQTHKTYRENVSTHFNTTAELIQQMTESYKDVYRHLASGAQTLCDHEVADKMLPAGERDRLFREEGEDSTATGETDDAKTGGDGPDAEPEPPRDYADRSSGGGALSEDYGLGKSGTGSEQAKAADSGEDATDDPDAPYRKPETPGREEQRSASDDAGNADKDSPEQDSRYKG
ncbi:MAG: DUF1043 family protein [Pseudohongiellaceae bacterium]